MTTCARRLERLGLIVALMLGTCGPAIAQMPPEGRPVSQETALENALLYAAPIAERPRAELRVNGPIANVLYCPVENPLRRFTPCELTSHEVCAPDAEMICLLGPWVHFAVPRKELPDRPYVYEEHIFEVKGEVLVPRGGTERLFLVIDSYSITWEEDAEGRVGGSTPPAQRFFYSREEGLIGVSEGHEGAVDDNLFNLLRSSGNLLMSDGPGFGAAVGTN